MPSCILGLSDWPHLGKISKGVEKNKEHAQLGVPHSEIQIELDW